MLNARSLRNLEGVHQDLTNVVRLAAQNTDISFIVTEGLRTIERQRELVAKGASRTMNSRHITGHAVDLAAQVNGRITWDWPMYERLAGTMKAAAQELGVEIEWGGDWESFRDGPHFQLPRSIYP